MPAGNPTPGELWESRQPQGQTLRGVVADVTPAMITLVSLTGNRHRIAPAPMELNWQFVSAPPRTPFICSRRGCSDRAVFAYSRGSSPEYVCPRHAPTATRLELLQDQPGAPQTSSNGNPAPLRCPHCGNTDPIEVRNGRMALPEVSGWSCLACNNMWQAITSEETRHEWWHTALMTAVHDIERNARRASLIRCHPSVLGVFYASPYMNISTDTGQQLMFHGIPVEPETRDIEQRTVIVCTERDRHSTRMSHVTREAAPPPLSMMENLRQLMRKTAEETDDFEDLELQLVPKGSRWTHKGTGQTVEVVSVNEGAVVFRQNEQTFPMLVRDFVQFHRPFMIAGESTEPAPNIEIHPDEEWESAEGVVKVLSVDSKREQVMVTWADGRKRLGPLTLREFATDKWRKIQRKSIFQRLLEDDD